MTHPARVVLPTITVCCVAVFGWAAESLGATVQPPAQEPSAPAVAAEPSDDAPGNVLVVILDDVGVDAVGCYPGSNSDALTPSMDKLAKEGLRFSKVWANPACSPTRATILTGRYGFRTGVGSVIRLKNKDAGLSLDEVCLPEALKAGAPGTKTAFLGKWHLAGAEHGPEHTVQQGFDYFRGTVGNIGRKGTGGAYWDYKEVHDGEIKRRKEYATTAVTNDALATIERLGAEPWLVMVSYHAAHTPLHAPPKELRSTELKGAPRKSKHAHFAAMVEALDHEIGRLWTSLPEATRARTTIIVVGDNGGSSGQMPSEVRDGGAGEKRLAGKGSLQESGILVPMIVAGRGVSDVGRNCAHPVNATDLFATTLELMGVASNEGPEDSVSFASYLASKAAPAQRTWIFSERFQRAIEETRAPATNRFSLRDGRFQLIEDCVRNSRRLFDLDADPRGHHNLLSAESLDDAAAAALAKFEAVLEGQFGKSRKEALSGLSPK